MITYVCKVVNLIVYRLTTSEKDRYRDIAIKKQKENFKYFQEQSYSFLQNRK